MDFCSWNHHFEYAADPGAIEAAAVGEVAAPKPGNVHRSADFEDMTFQDFQLSAIAVGPALDRAVSEFLAILDAPPGEPAGAIAEQTSIRHSRITSTLVVDPGMIIKSQGSRIELGFGANLLAEGRDGDEIVFTSWKFFKKVKS